MIWKWLKIGIAAIIVLALTIPLATYLIRVDWSRQHSERIHDLAKFKSSIDEGEYLLAANGHEFLIRVQGMQNSGREVILLHGFPETSIMWKPLMDSLAILGYRVLAFDQRGYCPGARPHSTSDYHIDSLVRDVISIADQVGFDTFHLVGHDWGSAVGWKVTLDHPDRIHTWTAMAIPHIGIFFPATQNHPMQKERSSYMNTLKLPVIPELFYHAFENRIYNGLKDRWTSEQIKEYRAVFAEPGAFKSVLNWYRAMDIEDPDIAKSFDKVIHRPTLYIYGSEDPVIAREIIPLQEGLIDTTYTLLELKAGHSLMQEAEIEVIRNIIIHIDQK